MNNLYLQNLLGCFIQLSALLSIPGLVHHAYGQQLSDEQFWASRKQIDQQAQKRLAEIETIAIELGIADAKLTSTLFTLDRDPKRQYIFLPGEDPLPDVDEIEPLELSRYIAAIHRLRAEHADRLFDLSKSIASSDPGRSYQLLNEVAWINPDHEEARRILGWTRGKTKWSKPERSIKERRTRQPHELFNWQPANYSLIRSGHFEVATTADVDTVIQLVGKMETWRDVWRQVAIEFWSDEKVMQRCFEDGGRIRDSINRRHNVVVFRNKEQYVQHLAPKIPGIEVSSGYYDFESKTSFFYLGENNESTSRHELVHQLFQESSRSDKNVARSRHIWAIEGIAMYFESLQNRRSSKMADPYITLGGFESHRLQFARLRKLREGFYLPMVELTGMDQKKWMDSGSVEKIYSQSSGLTHMIMNSERGKNRSAFLKWLVSVYEDSDVDGLQQTLQKSFAEIDQQYDAFIKVTSDEIPFADFDISQPSILCLRGALLDSDAISLLSNAKTLNILDLGKTPIKDSDTKTFEQLPNLAQLFLDETQLSDQAMISIANCKQLLELDVASTRITDAGLPALAKLSNLKILWISDNKLTDEGIKKLGPLTKLANIDISRTGVTIDGLKWLKEKLPNLK